MRFLQVRPMKRGGFAALLFVLALQALPASAQRFYTYVRDLVPDYVELAWGTAGGDNTIGRSSPSFGDATVEIAGRTLLSRGNQITVGELAPDRAYTYKVSIKGRPLGQGKFRTWAAKCQNLTLFAIRDYAAANVPQYFIARAICT